MILLLAPLTALPHRAGHVGLIVLEAGALIAALLLLLSRMGLPRWWAVVPLPLPFVQLGFWNGAVSNMLLFSRARRPQP